MVLCFYCFKDISDADFGEHTMQEMRKKAAENLPKVKESETCVCGILKTSEHCCYKSNSEPISQQTETDEQVAEEPILILLKNQNVSHSVRKNFNELIHRRSNSGVKILNPCSSLHSLYKHQSSCSLSAVDNPITINCDIDCKNVRFYEDNIKAWKATQIRLNIPFHQALDSTPSGLFCSCMNDYLSNKECDEPLTDEKMIDIFDSFLNNKDKFNGFLTTKPDEIKIVNLYKCPDCNQEMTVEEADDHDDLCKGALEEDSPVEAVPGEMAPLPSATYSCLDCGAVMAADERDDHDDFCEGIPDEDSIAEAPSPSREMTHNDVCLTGGLGSGNPSYSDHPDGAAAVVPFEHITNSPENDGGSEITNDQKQNNSDHSDDSDLSERPSHPNNPQEFYSCLDCGLRMPAEEADDHDDVCEGCPDIVQTDVSGSDEHANTMLISEADVCNDAAVTEAISNDRISDVGLDSENEDDLTGPYNCPDCGMTMLRSEAEDHDDVCMAEAAEDDPNNSYPNHTQETNPEIISDTIIDCSSEWMNKLLSKIENCRECEIMKSKVLFRIITNTICIRCSGVIKSYNFVCFNHRKCPSCFEIQEDHCFVCDVDYPISESFLHQHYFDCTECSPSEDLSKHKLVKHYKCLCGKTVIVPAFYCDIHSMCCKIEPKEQKPTVNIAEHYAYFSPNDTFLVCSSCNNRIRASEEESHNEMHMEEARALHNQINEVSHYSPLFGSELAEKCEAVGHLTCPPLPTGDCAIVALKQVLPWQACKYLSFFGKRYFEGWFNYLDLNQFLNSLGYNFSVKQDGKISKISSTHYPRTIVMELVGDNHWKSAELVPGHKYTMAQIAVSVLSIMRLKKLLKGKINKARNLSGVLCETCKLRFPWSDIDEHSATHIHLSIYGVAMLKVLFCRIRKLISASIKISYDSKAKGPKGKTNITLTRKVEVKNNWLEMLNKAYVEERSRMIDEAEDMIVPTFPEDVEEEDEDHIIKSTDAKGEDLHLDVDEELDCCWGFKNIDMSTSKQFIYYLQQFYEIMPDLACLGLALKNITQIFTMIHSSPDQTSSTPLLVKSCVKFRHDCLAYLCLNNTLDETTKFGTDSSLEFLGSNRTPDYVSIKGKNMSIYEFSVVGNVLRGNFQKGVSNLDSKYRQEIISAEKMGFLVTYHPIVASYNMSTDDNFEMLSQKGIQIADAERWFLHELLHCIVPEHIYLIALSFIEKPSVAGSEDRKETGWLYEYKSVNIRRWLSFSDGAAKLTDDFNYNLYFTATTNFVSKDNGTYAGRYLKELAKDELKAYSVFRKDLNGSKLHLLKGFRHKADYKVDLNTHSIKSLPEESEETFLNQLKFDRYGFETYKRYNDMFSKMQFGDLVTTFDIKSIDAAMCRYSKRLAEYSIETNTLPVKLNKPRRSFYNLLDSSACCDQSYQAGVRLKYKGQSAAVHHIMNRMQEVDFSKKIVSVEKPVDYKSKLESLMDWVSDYVPQPHRKSMKFIRALIPTEKISEFDALRRSMSSAQTEYIKSIKFLNSGVLKVDEHLSSLFKQEIDWSGGGIYKLYMGECKDLNTLKEVLISKTKRIDFRFAIPDNTDVPLFESLKKAQCEVLNLHISEVSSTALFQTLVFHSRLCYSLLAISNRNENNKWAVIDNLGLTNTALIVKGGKKILNTRKSKIFKLICPVMPEIADYLTGNHYSECLLNETPWMQLNQAQIMDGMSLPYKFLLNYSSLRSKMSFKETMDILFLPTMLSLHNKRKTEINLHNMRYFMVNVLGDLCQVQMLIDEFDTPPYSAFEHSLYHGFAKNYLSYVNSVRSWSELSNNSNDSFIYKQVQHPILDRKIINLDDYSYSIYSTYMMTKGQDNQSLEQVNNLKSVLETHLYHEDHPPRPWNDQESLYSSDFNYSKEISYEVGKAICAMIRKNHGVRSLHIKYEQLMNEGSDGIANNKGLRYKGELFFGHKGYYVVYKELFEDNFEAVLKCLQSSEDVRETRKSLKLLNKTYRMAQAEKPLDKCIFHIVDKVQRGGPREIYVMDYNTKLHQHTIEKMFKIICSLVDNEMITVPSGRRAAHIHHKNFEYGSDKYVKYNLTFDCRKWAPRSNFDKYIDMLDGMSEVLPGDFVTTCRNFFSKYKDKQIHTRTEIKESLIKNKKEFGKYFMEDEEKKSSFFIMPYSFVMGIFNMLSSLYHSGVQLLAEKYISSNSYTLFKLIVNLAMDAHSDDSVGSLSVEMKPKVDPLLVCRTSLSYYQHLQKACNHLMSVKKCTVSRVYLEFLSILYLNNELVPLLPKFLSNFTGVFSGKGISHDFRSVISKSIELQSNGESHTNCYSAQIIMSNFYRNFYRLKHDTTLPALGGFAASWPPLYLHYGSYIDEVRLSYTRPELFLKIMHFASDNMEFDPNDGTFSLKMLSVSRLPKAYRDIRKKIILPQFDDNQWFFSQNKTQHAYLNVLWFRAMLDDSNFMVSLLNINEIRRSVDSLRLASKKCIETKQGLFDINGIYNCIIKADPSPAVYYDIYKNFFKSAIEFYEDASLVESHSTDEKIPLSFKPTTLNMNDMNDVPTPKGKSLSVAVAICRPELSHYLFEDKSFDDSLERFRAFLISQNIPENIKTVKSFLDFVNKKRDRVSHVYCRVPSNKRVLVGSAGLMSHLQNSYNDKYRLNFNTNRFRSLAGHSNPIHKDIVEIVNANYLYHLAQSTRDSDMMCLNVRVRNRLMPLLSVPSVDVDLDSIYSQFLRYIGSFDGKSLNLAENVGYGFWLERQHKVMGEWVGKGQVIIKLKNTILLLSTNNNIVENIETNASEQYIFSNPEMDFCNLFMKENNLTIEQVPRTIAGFHFGYNKSGQMGIHKGETVKLGIPCFLNQPVFDKLPGRCSITYERGKHVIKYQSNNYTLQTFDYLCYRQYKSRLFDIINWEVLTDRQKTLLLDATTRGDFGDAGSLNYVQEDVISNFLNTDLYSAFYKQTIQSKQDLLRVMWADIINGSLSSDEILPILFEKTGVSEISKLLPDSKKENLRILQFFNVDAKILYDLRSSLSSLDNEAMQIDYLVKVLGDLGDNPALAKLPELGDPSLFKKFSFAQGKLNLHSCNSMWSELAEASAEAFNKLNTRTKHKLLKGSKSDLDSQLIYRSFSDLLCVRDYEVHEFAAFTFDMFLVHQLLDEIFKNQFALLEFAKRLRNTSLARLPKHPSYSSEWQIFLAGLYQYAGQLCVSEQDAELIPALRRRKDMKVSRPIVSPMVDLVYNREFEIEGYSEFYMKLGNLCNFQATFSTFEISRQSLEDFCDEEDVDWNFARSKEGKIISFKESAAPQELRGCVATRYFIPIRNIFSKYIGRKKYYLYNCNRDIALKDGWIIDACKAEIKSMKLYEKCYENSALETYSSLVEVKTIPEYDMPTHYYIATYNLHDPATYTEENMKKIIVEYKMSEENANAFLSIALGKRSAIGKALNISSFLKQLNQKNDDFLDLVNKALLRLNEIKSYSITEAEELMKLDMLTVGKDKLKLILKSTGYKKEILQMETLFPKLTAEMIINNVKLDSFRKTSLMHHINSVIRVYKQRKDSVKTTFFLFLKRLLSGLHDEVSSNENGLLFEEQLRILIEKNAKELSEEEDEDELFSEPTNRMHNWRVAR